MRIFSRALPILLFLYSASVSAIDPITGFVGKIYPHNSGKIYFKLEGDTCNSTWQYYYFDDSTTELIEANKNRYALLLSAAATKTAVTINVDNCIAENNEVVNQIWVDY